MFIFAHNLMLGYSKPGSRKDADFLKASINRFSELINLADEKSASIVLTGKSISTMRLEHWLRILEKISDFDAKIYLLVTSRPSDDLIALHKEGRITLVSSGNRRAFNQRGEMLYSGNLVHVSFDGEAFYYDTASNLFYFNDGKEITLAPIMQVDHNSPTALLVTKQTSKPFESQLIEFASEADYILMDYVDAIRVNSLATGESKFIDALKRADTSTSSVTIADAIDKLDAPDDILVYLKNLADQAEAFDEFAAEN